MGLGIIDLEIGGYMFRERYKEMLGVILFRSLERKRVRGLEGDKERDIVD